MKCGICQQKHDREERRAAERDAAVRRGPADERRQRARHRTDQRRERRPALHRRVDDQIDDDRRERQQRGRDVGARGQQREPAGREPEAERRGFGRRDAAVRQRTRPRAAHQRVGVALVHLVQHGGAACHERRAGDGAGHGDEVQAARSARRAEVVARGAGGDDEKVEARLGQREIVRGARGRSCDRDRRRNDVLHARAPRCVAGICAAGICVGAELLRPRLWRAV